MTDNTQDLNPFRPPEATILEAPVGDDAPRASRGRRFGTYVVDYLCYLAFCTVVGGILGFVFGQAATLALRNPVWRLVFGIVVLLVYYLFFEGLWARTPGKLVFGARVVDLQGGKPTFGAVIKRTLARCIPFEPFSMFGQAPWHDSLSRTRVILVRRD